MWDQLTLEFSLWEIVGRGTLVYLVVGMLIRTLPKRHLGDQSPNDLIALIMVGSMAANAITGEGATTLDMLLMILVVLLWDYLFNLAEDHIPRFRRVAQHSPTLLVHDGRMLEANLRKEKITEQELQADLRKRGVEDLEQVKLAVLEVDGKISVVRRDR